MSDEMNRNATEAYEAILQMAYRYNEYNAALQRMLANIDPQFLKDVHSIIKGYHHFATLILYYYILFYKSLNWAKITASIAPLLQIQQQIADITKMMLTQDIVYANKKISEGIMQSIERIDGDAAEKEQLKNIFQNEELLSCADDIVEEIANTADEEIQPANSAAANTQPEKFSLLEHGIELETAVLLAYTLAIPVFLLICIRGGSLTEDDFYAFWLNILQLLVGGYDMLKNFSREHPSICGMTTSIISGLITEQLKEIIRRDKEKTVE